MECNQGLHFPWENLEGNSEDWANGVDACDREDWAFDVENAQVAVLEDALGSCFEVRSASLLNY